jgi:hypothetical protein
VYAFLRSAAAINKLAKEAAKRSMKPAWRKDINGLEGGEALRKLFNALAKYFDGQVEAPTGTKERAFIRRVFQKALARLEEAPELSTLTNQKITMADLQALMWYPEKLFYDSAKKPEGEEVRAYEDDDAPDYANAARKLVRNRLGSAGRDGSGSGATGSGNRAQQNADGQGEVNDGQQQTTTLYQGGFPVDTAGLRRGRTNPEGGVTDTTDGVSNEPVTEADLDRIDEPDALRDILRRPGWGIVTANTVNETYGPTVQEWLLSASPGKPKHLRFICDVLGLKSDPPRRIRWNKTRIDVGLLYRGFVHG